MHTIALFKSLEEKKVWPRAANPWWKWMIISTVSTEWLLITTMLWGQDVPWAHRRKILSCWESRVPTSRHRIRRRLLSPWVRSWSRAECGASHCRHSAVPIPAHPQAALPALGGSRTPQDRVISSALNVSWWITPARANHLAPTSARISNELLPLFCDKTFLRMVMKELGEIK